MAIKLLLLILFLTSAKVSGKSWCSHTKSNNNSCACTKTTDRQKQIPISTADCSRINLDHFPRDIDTDLTVLDLSHNQLTKLDGSHNSTLLSTLILSYNSIQVHLNPEFFNLVPNLERLQLDHNKLTTLRLGTFKNLKNLQYLDLSNNQLAIVPQHIFTPLIRLRHLDLSYNDNVLSKVFIVKNPLFNLGLNVNITRLQLNRIGLKNIDGDFFDNFTKIEHLELAYNEMETIPNVPHTVEYLDLSGSQFPEIQAKYLSYQSLKVLKLNRLRKLDTIHHYAFCNLVHLEDLSLEDSGLQTFNELAFGLLSKQRTQTTLKRINLSKNQLKSLNYTYRYLFKQLELVDFRDNPWNCNCDLLWLQNLDNLNNYTDIRCNEPRSVYRKRISEIQDEDLPSCHPEKYGKTNHRILIPILVVLILILCALVTYLIYFSPNSYLNRTRIGPGSPYNLARSEEI